MAVGWLGSRGSASWIDGVGCVLMSGPLASIAWTCLHLAARPATDDGRRPTWRLLAWSAAACLLAIAARTTAEPDLTTWALWISSLLALAAVLRHPVPDVPHDVLVRVRIESTMVTATVLVAVVAAWSVVGPAAWPGWSWTACAAAAAGAAAAWGLARLRLSWARWPTLAGVPVAIVAVAIAAADGRAAAGRAATTHDSIWAFAAASAALAALVQTRLAGVRAPSGSPGRARAGVTGQWAIACASLVTTFTATAVLALGHPTGKGIPTIPLGPIPVPAVPLAAAPLAAAAVMAALVLSLARAADAENQRLHVRNAQAVAERDELRASLHRLAFEDPLTGVANRSQFTSELAAAQAEAGRRGTSVAVLLVDLDDFKPVNDRYGHAAGDTVLRVCAARMSACLGPDDLLARIGGDEFAVVLRQSYKLAATSLGERIVAVLREPIPLGGDGDVVVRIGASVGVAASSAGRRAPELLLRDADRAMYRAKERGKGTVGIS